MKIEINHEVFAQDIKVSRELVEAYDPHTGETVEAWKSDTIEVLPYQYHLLPEARDSYSLAS